jgi:hypothetical protein
MNAGLQEGVFEVDALGAVLKMTRHFFSAYKSAAWVRLIIGVLEGLARLLPLTTAMFSTSFCSLLPLLKVHLKELEFAAQTQGIETCLFLTTLR